MPAITPCLLAMLVMGRGVGDHRALVVDLWDQDIFGKHLVHSALPEARKLTGALLVSHCNYAQLLWERLLAQKVIKHIDQLAILGTCPLSQEQQVEVEALDRTLIQEHRRAKRGCRKLWLGKVPYSKELSCTKKHVWLWQMVVQKKKGCKINNYQIKHLAATMGVIKPLTGTQKQAECSLDLVEQAYA